MYLRKANKTISIGLCAEVFTSATKRDYYTVSACNYTTMVTTLLALPFISICHFPSPSPTEAGLPLSGALGFAAHWRVFMSTWKLQEHFLEKFPESVLSGKEYFLQRIQVGASLRESWGSFLEHHEDVSITMKSGTLIFWFPRVYRSYVHMPSKSATALSLP